MRICHCTLAGTRACDTCPNGASAWTGGAPKLPEIEPVYWQDFFKPKTVKKVVEKFDKDGKLVERITTEEQAGL